jgi:hypothetical protein
MTTDDAEAMVQVATVTSAEEASADSDLGFARSTARRNAGRLLHPDLVDRASAQILFGIIILLLAIVGVVQGISNLAGLLLMIPAFQMIAGYAAPTFPRRLANRQLPTHRLVALVQRAVPVLRHLEKVVHPRWPYHTRRPSARLALSS